MYSGTAGEWIWELPVDKILERIHNRTVTPDRVEQGRIVQLSDNQQSYNQLSDKEH